MFLWNVTFHQQFVLVQTGFEMLLSRKQLIVSICYAISFNIEKMEKEVEISNGDSYITEESSSEYESESDSMNETEDSDSDTEIDNVNNSNSSYNVAVPGLSMNDMQSHLHTLTRASIYLSVLLSHVQNFTWQVNHMTTLQQVCSVIDLLHVQNFIWQVNHMPTLQQVCPVIVL